MNKIEKTLSPKNSDVEFLLKKIIEEYPKYGVDSPFAFFIRDDEKKIIAGVYSAIIYGVVYTVRLWVDERYRNQGLASQLMNNVHEFGRTEGCKIATANTMSFQAEGFYKKLGYKKDFERSGYAKNSSVLFMSKDL